MGQFYFSGVSSNTWWSPSLLTVGADSPDGGGGGELHDSVRKRQWRILRGEEIGRSGKGSAEMSTPKLFASTMRTESPDTDPLHMKIFGINSQCALEILQGRL